MEPWRLAEINYAQVKSNPPFEAAVLPLGATEPHNLHLPYGTDTFQVEVDRREGMRLCCRERRRVLLLPALPYGTETNQMKFPLAMNLNPSTVARVIGDLVDSLADARDLALPALERAWRQRPEMGAARASSVDEGALVLVQLVQGIF